MPEPPGFERARQKVQARLVGRGPDIARRKTQERIENDLDAPNNLERAIAGALHDKPTVQELLYGFAQPISAVMNLAEAGVHYGRHEDRLARERLGSAARSAGEFGRFLTFNKLPPVASPEDFRGGVDVLKAAGVGSMGVYDVPVVGKVTGRGIAGLGVDILADPLRVTKVGKLTKAGTSARAAGALAKPTMPGLRLTSTGFVRDASRAGSRVAAEVAAKQRALVQFMGRTVVRDIPLPDRLGGSMMELVDTAKRGFARSTLGRAFVRSTLPETAATLDKAVGGASFEAIKRTEKAAEMWRSFQNEAAAAGIPENEVARLFLLGAERKLKFAADPALRAQARQLIADYRKAGFSRNEAIDAARVAQNFPFIKPDMAPLVAGYMRHFGDVLKNERIAGVAVESLGDQGLNYVTRVLTDEAQEFLRRNPDLMHSIRNRVNNWLSAKHGSTRARKATYEGMPIPEINDYIATHVKRAGFTGKLFSEDPALILARRAIREGQGVGAARALRTFADEWGVARAPWNEGTHVALRDVMDSNGMRPYELRGGGNPWPTIADETTRIAKASGGAVGDAERQAIAALLKRGEIVPTRLAGVEDLVVPHEVAADIARVMKARFSPSSSTGLWNLVDQATRLFKTYVTVPFLEFHSRNAITAIAHNWYADVVNPRSYSDAMRVVDAWRSGREISLRIGADNWTAADLKTLMEAYHGRYGTVGGFETRTRPVATIVKGVAGKPGEGIAARVAKAPVRAAVAPIQIIGRGGEKLGFFVEDTVRLAHVIEKMRKGAKPGDAILSMKRYQFDYADLTPFEKSVMRRAVPFYTWMRKNLPLQIETMVSRPGKVSTIAHVQRWLQQDGAGDGPMDSRIVPEWTRRRLFGVKREGDDLRIVSGLGIGFEDLAIFDRPSADFLASLNPLIKSPLQYATNRDFFRDVPLERSRVAPTWFRHFEAVPGGKAFLGAIDFKMDEHRGYATANPKWLNLIAGLPVTSASTRFSNVFERATRQRQSDPDFWLKFATGIRVQKLPRAEQMRQHMIAMLEVTRDRIRELRLQGFVGAKELFYPEPSIRRSPLLGQDPRTRESAILLRLERRLSDALSKVSNAALVETKRESLRSGGQ